MVFFSVPRSLFYKERKKIGDFIFDNQGDFLESQFFKKLIKLSIFKSSRNVAEYVLSVFNNACYICTLIAYEEYPALYLNNYRDIADKDNFDYKTNNHLMPATMALVYNWLNTTIFRKHKEFITGVADFESFIEDLYNYFYDCSLWNKDDFYSLVFEKGEYLSKLKDFDFDPRDIKEIVNDYSIPFLDIANGINYLLDCFEEEIDDDKEQYYFFSQILDRLKNEVHESNDYGILADIENKINNRLQHLSAKETKHANHNIIDGISVDNIYKLFKFRMLIRNNVTT